ncbi:MAG: nuclear transport factor 2 family protein [Gammaproteobacteria bacterium]
MKSPTAAVLALALLFLSPAATAADASIEARLHVLEAKEAIRTLLFNYGRYVDDRNWEAFAELFAENGGTWNGGMGIARGRGEIVAMMTSTLGTAANVGADGSGMSNLHLMGNEIITVDGDTATSLSKWVFVMTAEDNGPDVVFVGRYNDEFVRENGEWKFRLRTVTSDIARPVALPGLDTGN